jgi:methionyl-tRNA formyltransferase
MSNGYGDPGLVLNNYLEVCCNNKSIKIIEIQRQGKRPQNINEFMIGSQIKKGSNLSNA